MKRFTVSFSLPTFPYLAFMRNWKASFPGEIHPMIANTGLRALLDLISGEIPVKTEPVLFSHSFPL